MRAIAASRSLLCSGVSAPRPRSAASSNPFGTSGIPSSSARSMTAVLSALRYCAPRFAHMPPPKRMETGAPTQPGSGVDDFHVQIAQSVGGAETGDPGSEHDNLALGRSGFGHVGHDQCSCGAMLTRWTGRALLPAGMLTPARGDCSSVPDVCFEEWRVPLPWEAYRIEVSNFMAGAIHSSGYRGTHYDAETAVTWEFNFRHPPQGECPEPNRERIAIQ